MYLTWSEEMHRLGAVIQATGSKIRETDGVITDSATLTYDNYQKYGLKLESDLDDDFHFQISIQKAHCSAGDTPYAYPFLNKECHLGCGVYQSLTEQLRIFLI